MSGVLSYLISCSDVVGNGNALPNLLFRWYLVSGVSLRVLCVRTECELTHNYMAFSVNSIIGFNDVFKFFSNTGIEHN